MKDVLQNTARGFWVFADDASAIGTGMTGLTITAEISKGGAAFATVAPTITERGEGLYWIVPIAAHRDTLGETAWRFAATGAVIAPRVENVVAYDAQLTAVGAAVAADIVSAADIRTELAVELGRIDENTSAAKTLTAATLATLFDDSDASQQLSDFFAGLIDRFDDATDVPVTTVAAATVAQLFAHASMVELLADAEAARAAAVSASSAASGAQTAVAGLNNLSSAEILTTALTESYAADGVAPTLSQLLFLIAQHLGESSIVGTTKTVKQIDGATPAATFTLDSATAPTSITRAS